MAGWIVLMQLLDMYIVVLPALHGTGVHLSILDFCRSSGSAHARFLLSPHRRQDFALSGARSATD